MKKIVGKYNLSLQEIAMKMEAGFKEVLEKGNFDTLQNAIKENLKFVDSTN